jgi:hypothetical protein
MEIPATWDALAQASTYGDLSLQLKLDYIKYSVFGNVVAQTTEDTTYNPIQLMYAAKMLALEIIPAGMDYWNDQSITFSGAARQSSESVSYPDRIRNLQIIYARLTSEAEKLASVLLGDGTIKTTKRMRMPMTTHQATGQQLKSNDPWNFTAASDVTQYSTTYPFRW